MHGATSVRRSRVPAGSLVASRGSRGARERGGHGAGLAGRLRCLLHSEDTTAWRQGGSSLGGDGQSDELATPVML